MRNWEEDQDVIVVYPGGKVRQGTIARCFTDHTYSVIFYPADGQTTAEEADPHVPESCLRVPGLFMEMTSTDGCADKELQDG